MKSQQGRPVRRCMLVSGVRVLTRDVCFKKKGKKHLNRMQKYVHIKENRETLHESYEL